MRAFLLLAVLLAPTPASASEQPAEPVPSAEAPGTQPVTLEALREAQRQRLVESMSSLSALPPARLDEVLRLSLRDGLFEVECPLGSTGGVHRIELTDLPGLAQINCGADEQSGSRWIEWQHSEFETPEAVVTLLQVFARDNYLQIAADFVGPQRSGNMQLIQSPRNPGEDSHPHEQVRLYVQSFAGSEENIIERVSLQAANFPELLRQHRSEVLRHVISPLARRKLHRAILTTPLQRAWLVLETADPPPQVAGRVAELVHQLNAEAYSARRAAADELAKLGPAGALALRRVDRARLSEEQRQAIETILAGYGELSESQRAELASDPLFLIGVLYSEERPLWPTAIERLMQWRSIPSMTGSVGDAEQVRQMADAWLGQLIAELPTSQPSETPMDRGM
ncbi:MAG: hypothetical protein NZ561_02470 [Phycisphaerae bacterium]|nr:hypothetical protein [Phycisphaerae bacterium]MDW8261722.1 hypothetical protein [Phycisphaerales bacterium]